MIPKSGFFVRYSLFTAKIQKIGVFVENTPLRAKSLYMSLFLVKIPHIRQIFRKRGVLSKLPTQGWKVQKWVVLVEVAPFMPNSRNGIFCSKVSHSGRIFWNQGILEKYSFTGKISDNRMVRSKVFLFWQNPEKLMLKAKTRHF